MPLFGFCTSLDNAPLLKSIGWDYIEEGAQGLLQGLAPDDQWEPTVERVAASPLPVLACNGLVPGALKITGSGADIDTLRTYMTRVLTRAGRLGVRTLVFGSGAARNVPDGFDRDRAEGQVADFLRMAAPVASAAGVTVVLEHLRRAESNILTTLPECLALIRRLNLPSVQCLLDTYHLWSESGAPADVRDVRDALPHIRHVHVADLAGRAVPGESGTADYRPLFSLLKRANYDGCISVEANVTDLTVQAPRALAFLRQQWSEA